MDKDATWQKEPKVYKTGEIYATKSINNDPLDNKFRAVWAPELHYIDGVCRWQIYAKSKSEKVIE